MLKSLVYACGSWLRFEFATVAGVDEPCEDSQAEITVGELRACASYADADAQDSFRSQPMELLSSSMVLAVPEMGCSPLENAAQVAGNIAVINRGACLFTEKALNAQAAGAVAVIIMNNRIEPDEPLARMSGDFSAVTIPAMMVSQAGGKKLRENLGRAAAIKIGMRSVAKSNCRDAPGPMSRCKSSVQESSLIATASS
jgi:hypothetical protein